MHRKVVLSLAVLFCLASIANAAPSIIQATNGSNNLADQLTLQPSAVDGAGPIAANSIHLLPNTAHQAIQIFVSGGLNVQGLVLEAQVADGGPNENFNTPGVINGPTITGDVITGTIFASNHTTPTDPGGGVEGPMTAWISVTTQAGTVTASGLLATLFVDTTGFTSGQWELDLGGTAGSNGGGSNAGGGTGLYDNAGGPIGNNLPTGSTSLAGVATSAYQVFDTSIVVPEPSSVVLGLFAAVGLGFVAIRRRMARRAA